LRKIKAELAVICRIHPTVKFTIEGMNMTIIKTIALPIVAALALTGTAQAQDFKPKAAGVNIVDLRVSVVDPDAGDSITTLAGAPTGLKADVSSEVMPSLGLTHFFTDHVAVEVIATTTKHTIKAKGAGVDVKVKDTWVLPPVVSVQYHFLPSGRVSPYVGAGVNYMLFYNGSDKNGFHLKLDDGFGAALQAGVDIATGGPWSLNLDAKKVFFETDAVDQVNGVKSKVHLDPWVLSAGFGYRF
jgi:outer membrane protein